MMDVKCGDRIFAIGLYRGHVSFIDDTPLRDNAYKYGGHWNCTYDAIEFKDANDMLNFFGEIRCQVQNYNEYIVDNGIKALKDDFDDDYEFDIIGNPQKIDFIIRLEV